MLCFHFEKKLLKRFHQRKCPEAGFCFRAVGYDQLQLSIYHSLSDGVANGNGLSLKVNGIPFQTDDLATAQTVESSSNNSELSRISFENLEHLVKLGGVVVGSYILLNLR